MKLLYIFLILLVLTACDAKKSSDNDSTNADSVLVPDEEADVNTKPGVNTILVEKNCVIFLYPDSIEIEEMKKKYGEDDFYTVADDLSWYQGTAGIILDSLKIKQISSDKEYIILKNNKNVCKKYTRKALDGDMILFNVNKEPIIKSSIDFDQKMVLKYFDK
jgi:hypothetical protein